MNKVAVIQSNYIPWKGYFDIINDVDHFIFYDDVQYTKNDWRNRNRIMTPNRSMWITIPVGASLDRLINEVKINDFNWQDRHWKSIKQNYSRAPYFKKYREFFEEIYLARKWHGLSELNQYVIKKIAVEILNVKTRFSSSELYNAQGERQERLLEVLKKANADTYISGPAARDYIELDRFKDAGIQLVYKDYSGYPEYAQMFRPFDHFVSIIDLIFNSGPDAAWYIWGWRQEPDRGNINFQ